MDPGRREKCYTLKEVAAILAARNPAVEDELRGKIEQRLTRRIESCKGATHAEDETTK